MAFSTVASAVLHGVQAEIIQVETDVSNGLPVFHMVGYLSSEVKEAAERVRTAIQNCGMQLPPKKIVVNLAPATMRKRGASYDLPIALSVLAAMGVFSVESLRGVVVAGELGLGGAVQKISGILPIVKRAKECGYHTCIVPKENVTEGALVEGVRILGADTLLAVCRYLQGEEELSWAAALGKEKWEAVRNAEELDEQIDFCHIRGQEIVKRAAEVAVSGGHNLLLAGPPGRWEAVRNAEELDEQIDFCHIRGQEIVKRAAEVAVSGGHNLLLAGPPGSGKSMTAKAITSILPSLSMEESLEITRIYSVLGLLREDYPLITARPFRNVHHTTTKAALVGGGNPPLPGEISLAHGGVLFLDELTEFQKPVLEVLRQPLEEQEVHLSRSHGPPLPGEISLAHGGVLFLDELTEFQKPVLEVLRQPLEEQEVHLSRSHGNYVFPADVMLVAAMNPCPCGNYPDPEKCSCTPGQIQRYLDTVSQPFLDRMDLCVEAPRISYEELKKTEEGESSGEIRIRVERARAIQNERYAGTKIRVNARLGVKELPIYCKLGEKEEQLMEQAFHRLHARAIQNERYAGTKIRVNARLGVKELPIYCKLGEKEEQLMEQAFHRLHLTARTYHRILKVSRTIADMEGVDRIRTKHIKEALGYRTLEKKYWGR